VDFTDKLHDHLMRKFSGIHQWLFLNIADDVRIIAPPAILKEAIAYVVEHCPPPDSGRTPAEPFSFSIRPHKCSLFSLEGPSFFDGVFSEDDFMGVNVSKDGEKILGSFIGSDEFVKNACLEEVKSWKQRLNILVEFSKAHAQDAFLLLRSCHTTRINHLLRTTPPELVRPTAIEFDRMTREAVASIDVGRVGVAGPSMESSFGFVLSWWFWNIQGRRCVRRSFRRFARTHNEEFSPSGQV
jgi:hypothetical protein